MTITHFDDDDVRSDRIAAQRAERERRRKAAQAFTPVDDLPKKQAGRAARPVPEVRQSMLDYCLTHPGRWVRYSPDPDVDSVKSHTLTTYAKKRQGGFTAGFEVAVREKVAYIRYVGSAQ